MDGERLRVIRSFAFHALVGTVLFMFVYAVSLVPEVFERLLTTNTPDPLLRGVAKALKAILLLLDACLYTVFLVKTSGRLMRRL